jgi:integrase
MTTPTEAEVNAAHGQLLADMACGKVKVTPDPLSIMNATIEVGAMKDRAAFARDTRARRGDVLRKHLATGETALIEWAADDVIARGQLLIEKGSPAYRDLCHKLQRAELATLQGAEERDRGEWDGSPKDSLIKPALHVVSDKTAAPGEAIMELYARFKREKAGAASSDTWAMNVKIVKLFAEFAGEGVHVSAINRKTVRAWRDALFKWPIKASESGVFAGMAFKKVIEANARHGKPTISDRTINKYLSALGSFAEWLLSNDYITEDVMRGMYLSLDKRAKTRMPYTSTQLVSIFSSPLFVGCRGDKREHEAGNVKIRDWRFWIPLIGLYTGARLGEIAQFLVADVRQVHGQWVLHVTREGSARKSVKTAGSERIIPMHPELIKIGLLDYHASMKQAGKEHLFPEIKPDARAFFSGVPSGFWNDYVRQIGVKVDKSVNFHSLRHGIADAFRRASYLDEQFGILLGHSKASMTGRYGIMPEGVLSERRKMIEAVSYPGLDLSHLYPEARPI